MRAHEFVVCLREYEVADLGAGIDGAQWLQSLRIPKPNVLVRCSSPCCQQPSVQGAPVDCLDSRLVLTKSCQWFARVTLAGLPDHELVVIATGGKHRIVMRTPSQTANLLLMALQIHYEVALRPHISHLD